LFYLSQESERKYENTSEAGNVAKRNWTRDISNIQPQRLLQWGHVDGRWSPQEAVHSWNFESLCLHRATEARFLTPAVGRTVDKSEWTTSGPDRFSCGREPRCPLNTSLVGPRAGLEVLEKRKTSCCYRDSKLLPSRP